MLQNIKRLYGSKLGATDGDIGHVKDFYFDDTTWAVRYLVDKSWVIGELIVETGHWCSRKETLISPSKVERINYEESKVFVNLTKEVIQRTSESGVAQAVVGNLHK